MQRKSYEKCRTVHPIFLSLSSRLISGVTACLASCCDHQPELTSTQAFVLAFLHSLIIGDFRTAVVLIDIISGLRLPTYLRRWLREDFQFIQKDVVMAFMRLSRLLVPQKLLDVLLGLSMKYGVSQECQTLGDFLTVSFLSRHEGPGKKNAKTQTNNTPSVHVAVCTSEELAGGTAGGSRRGSIKVSNTAVPALFGVKHELPFQLTKSPGTLSTKILQTPVTISTEPPQSKSILGTSNTKMLPAQAIIPGTSKTNNLPPVPASGLTLRSSVCGTQSSLRPPTATLAKVLISSAIVTAPSLKMHETRSNVQPILSRKVLEPPVITASSKSSPTICATQSKIIMTPTIQSSQSSDKPATTKVSATIPFPQPSTGSLSKRTVKMSSARVKQKTFVPKIQKTLGPQKPLNIAALNGDYATVKQLLSTGADPEEQDGAYDNTGIHWAVKGDNVCILELYKNHGANMAVKNNKGWTLLHVAVLSYRCKCILWLLQLGADIEATNNFLQTPLHIAAHNGNCKAVRILLDHGAQIETRSVRDNTPLYVAVNNGQTGVARLLLESGADPNTRDDWCRNLIQVVIQKGSLELMELLIEYNCDLNVKDDWDRTPLHNAVEASNMKGLILLLEKGADIEARDRNGCTPIYEAAKSGNTKAVRTLLERGADPSAMAKDGSTPASVTQDQIIKNILSKSDHVARKSK